MNVIYLVCSALKWLYPKRRDHVVVRFPLADGHRLLAAYRKDPTRRITVDVEPEALARALGVEVDR